MHLTNTHARSEHAHASTLRVHALHSLIRDVSVPLPRYITLANFLPDPDSCSGHMGTFTVRDLFVDGGPLPKRSVMTYKLRCEAGLTVFAYVCEASASERGNEVHHGQPVW